MAAQIRQQNVGRAVAIEIEDAYPRTGLARCSLWRLCCGAHRKPRLASHNGKLHRDRCRHNRLAWYQLRQRERTLLAVDLAYRRTQLLRCQFLEAFEVRFGIRRFALPLESPGESKLGGNAQRVEFHRTPKLLLGICVLLLLRIQIAE